MGFFDLFKGKQQPKSDPFATSQSPQLGTVPSPYPPNSMGSQPQNPMQQGNDPLNQPIGGAGDQFGGSSFQSGFSSGSQASSFSGNNMPGVGLQGPPEDDTIGTPGSNFAANSFQHDTPYPQQMPGNPGADAMDAKNMELVLAKLDAIRTAIQNLDHRITRIEERLGTQNQNQQNGGLY